MMMAQKKPRTLQGTTLTFNNAIRSRLSYDPLFTPVTYGRCYQAATPTPSSPVTVQTVSGRLVACGKNLFDKSMWATPTTLQGITIQYLDSEDCFVLNGTALAAAGFPLKYINISVMIGEKYTASCRYVGGTVTRPNGTEYAVAYFGKSDSLSSYANWQACLLLNGDASISATVDKKYISAFWFFISSGVVFNNYKVKIQLELGSTATAYVPYTGMTATLPTLSGIEVASTALPNVSWVDGGVTKYAVADTWEPCVMVDGALRSRKTQRVGIRVFDGAENVGTVISYTNTYRFDISSILVGRVDGNAGNMICTHLPLTVNASDEIEHFRGTANANGGHILVIWIAKTRIDGLSGSTLQEKLKSFLTAQYAAGTPVTVYYILSSPVVTLGDPVLFEAYAPQTNIYTTSPLQGQIKASVLVPRAT